MICHISHICMFTALSLVLFQFYKGGRFLLPALPSTTRRSSGAIWSIVSFCLYIYCQIHTYIVKLPAQCFTVCWLKWSLQQSNFLQCSWPAGSLRVVAENLDRCCWNFELVISAGLMCSAKPSVNWFPDRLSARRSPSAYRPRLLHPHPPVCCLWDPPLQGQEVTGSHTCGFIGGEWKERVIFFKTINSVQESQSSSSCGLAFLLAYWC